MYQIGPVTEGVLAFPDHTFWEFTAIVQELEGQY